MRAKKLSAKRLAGLAGYKSKTSIVRILREESVHSGRERLFARMDELGLLTPDERQALLRGLEFSRVGGDRAMARLGLRRLLTGEWNARAPAPALANALESLRAAHSARILLLNGCHPEVVLPLRDILRKRPAHAMEHFVTVGASARQDMDALCAILSIAFVPAYAVRSKIRRRQMACRRGRMRFVSLRRTAMAWHGYADTLPRWRGCRHPHAASSPWAVPVHPPGHCPGQFPPRRFRRRAAGWAGSHCRGRALLHGAGARPQCARRQAGYLPQ